VAVNWWLESMSFNIGILEAGGGGSPVLAETVFNEDSVAPFQAVMPASITSNELLILVAHRASGAGTPSGTPPSGWTSLISGADHQVYYKWAAGTEGGTNVTVTASGSLIMFLTLLRIIGADSAQNPEASTVATASGTNNPDPPAVDPSWADTNNLFIAVALTDDAIGVSAYPSGYTLGQASNVATSGSSGVASKTSISSAAENPGAFTFGGNMDSRAFTLAVKGT
jgi:hypothetical protein